jgi:hypothetical protein
VTSKSVFVIGYFYHCLHYVLQVKMMDQCKAYATSHADPSVGFLCVQIS